MTRPTKTQASASPARRTPRARAPKREGRRATGVSLGATRRKGQGGDARLAVTTTAWRRAGSMLCSCYVQCLLSPGAERANYGRGDGGTGHGVGTIAIIRTTRSCYAGEGEKNSVERRQVFDLPERLIEVKIP